MGTRDKTPCPHNGLITLIKMSKVMQSTTLAKSTIYSLVKEGKFPKPFKISKRASVWDEQEVIDYIVACKEAS